MIPGWNCHWHSFIHSFSKCYGMIVLLIPRGNRKCSRERGSDILGRWHCRELVVWLPRPPSCVCTLSIFSLTVSQIELSAPRGQTHSPSSSFLLLGPSLVCLPTSLWFSKFCHSKTKLESLPPPLRRFSLLGSQDFLFNELLLPSVQKTHWYLVFQYLEFC